MIGELKTDECVIIGPTLVCFNFSFVRVKKAVAELVSVTAFGCYAI